MASLNAQNSSLVRSSTNWHARILLVLGVAGVLVSAYLTYKTSDPSGVVCSLGGGCETVLSSKYSKLFGIPVSAFGLLWYVAMLGVTWWIFFKRIWSSSIAVIWALAGLFFSLYLLYLEAFVIHAYCTWCLVSLGLVVIINIMVFTKRN